MTGRRIVVALGAILCVLLWYLAYYGSRGPWIFHMSTSLAEGGMGYTWDEARDVFDTLDWVLCVTPLLGALLCVAVGPRIGAPLGALVTFSGMLALLLSPPRTALPALSVLALGKGILWAGLVAAVVQLFRYPLENARNAIVLGFYVAMNAGILLGNSATRALLDIDITARALIVAWAVLMVLALVTLAVVGWLARPPGPADAGPRIPPGKVLLGAAILVVLILPHAGMFTLGIRTHVDILQGALDPPTWDTVRNLNPLTVILAGTVFCGGLLAISGRRPLPAAILLGIGMLGYALLLAPMAVPERLGDAAGAFALFDFMGCAALEPLLGGLIFARVAGDLGPRSAALAVGVVSSLDATADTTIERLVPDSATATGIGVSVGICLIAGLLLLAIAYPIQRRFFTPPQ